jgi:hypothetical protein
MVLNYAVLVPHVAALLAYLAGLIVAIFLLVRARGTAAILAVVGFAVLILISIGQIVLAVPPVNRELFRAGQWSVWGLNCCCSILDVGAIVCLIVAIWQAVLGTGAGETAEGVVTVDTPEEQAAPGETPYGTRVLEETLEGQVLEDTQTESPYATQ